MNKLALLIGVSEYKYKADWLSLPAALKDVEAMQRVLENPDIGGYKVKPLINPDLENMQLEIENLFKECEQEDLVLLYFSGHGAKDETGNLYLAAYSTRKDRLMSTAVAASVVNNIMNCSRSQQQVLILDCCFSGAFPKNLSPKYLDSVNIKKELGGQGRVILTSSTSSQYSFEHQENGLSIYTHYLVEGIETGRADRNHNGWISVDDLHQYVQEQVQQTASMMKPEIHKVTEGFSPLIVKNAVEPKQKLRISKERDALIESYLQEDEEYQQLLLEFNQKTLNILRKKYNNIITNDNENLRSNLKKEIRNNSDFQLELQKLHLDDEDIETIQENILVYEEQIIHQKLLIFYQVWLNISQEVIVVGEDLEVTITLGPLSPNNIGYQLEIPHSQAVGSELNIILSAPGFKFNGNNTATLPLVPETNTEIYLQQLTQSVCFSLKALRPGSVKIIAELYCGDTFEANIEAKIEVAGFDKAGLLGTSITTQPRPISQPNFILQVQTIWNEASSTCRFQYQLRSLLAEFLSSNNNDIYVSVSDVLSCSWIEHVRRLLETTLKNISGDSPFDGRNSLASLGQYLFRYLLPTELQSIFRSTVLHNHTFSLLILADQDAWMPWELLHDGQQFLNERFIVGRWLLELNDTRTYEFPLGAINLTHDTNVEQPELWATLLEAPGAPPNILLEGILQNLGSTEAIWGLHLIGYTQSLDTASLRNTPINQDNIHDTQGIEHKIRPLKLNLLRHRPLVTLGYVKTDTTELTNLEQTWALAFIRAGCSAFIGSLWAVDAAVEAAFISNFYNRLWTGASLGEAFYSSRQVAHTAVPDSLDWLAYVLVGDPMARPYLPVEGKGYAVVEPIDREIDEPLPPGVPMCFRLSLRRTPPVWHEERVIEVAENLTFENLQVHIKTFGLQVTPDSPIAMTLAPNGNYLGWCTVVAPTEMVGNSALVQVYFMDGALPIHSIMFSLNIANKGGE